MDKLAGLYTQIQTLKKRLNSLDLSKEDPGVASALKADLDALEDRYTKISEAKKKRQQEKLSKDAPAAAPEVTVEATPEPEGGYPVDPKWGQDHEVSPWKCSCGTILKSKNQGLAHYRAHHGKDKDKYEVAVEAKPEVMDHKCTNKGSTFDCPTCLQKSLDQEKTAEESLMDTKCEGCGKPLGAEVFLSKWPVCGSCTKKRHKEVTKSAEPETPSIADQMVKPTTEPTQVVESAEELEAKKKKKKNCHHCGYFFPVGGSIVSHPCSHAAPSDPCGGAPAGDGGGMGDAGAGAGAAGGGAAAAAEAAPSEAILHKFSSDDIVEPTKGTPGSWGSVLRHDGGPEDLVYVKWHGGPLKEMHSGYGGYTATDLRKKASLSSTAAEGENGYICFYKGKQFEVYAKTSYEAQQKCAKENGIKKPHEINVVLAEKGGAPVVHNPQDVLGSEATPEAPIIKEEDLEMEATKNAEVVKAFFDGAKKGHTKNVSINPTNAGPALWNYATPIVLEKDGTYYFNVQKYSQTTSKLQNMIRSYISSLPHKEVDESEIREAMTIDLVKHTPQPKDPNNYLTDHTPSAIDPNNLPVLPKVKAPTKVPLQVANLKLSAVDGNPHVTQPLADPVDPAEKGGVGYGGDRPGSAVAPARDADITLDAATACASCGKPGAKRVSKTNRGGHKVFCDEKCMDKFMQKMNRDASISIESHIKHENGKWVVYNHDNTKQLGHYPTKEEAVTRLRQIEYFKHKGSLKLSTRDIKAEAAPIATEIATQCQQIRDRMKSFQDGLKTQASSGSDEAFKILRIDIEKLRKRYGDYPEAKEALDAIVYEMEQLTKTPGVVETPPAPAVDKAAAGMTNVPDDAAQDAFYFWAILRNCYGYLLRQPKTPEVEQLLKMCAEARDRHNSRLNRPKAPAAAPAAEAAKECSDCHGNYEGKEGEKCPTCGRFAVMPVKEAAGTNVPPKPSQDPGLNMMWWYNTTTNTWEIKDKTI